MQKWEFARKEVPELFGTCGVLNALMFITTRVSINKPRIFRRKLELKKLSARWMSWLLGINESLIQLQICREYFEYFRSTEWIFCIYSLPQMKLDYDICWITNNLNISIVYFFCKNGPGSSICRKWNGYHYLRLVLPGILIWAECFDFSVTSLVFALLENFDGYNEYICCLLLHKNIFAFTFLYFLTIHGIYSYHQSFKLRAYCVGEIKVPRCLVLLSRRLLPRTVALCIGVFDFKIIHFIL